MKRTILILLCIVLAIGGGLFMYNRSAFKYRNDVLEYCTVSTGGGMLGGYSSYSLKKDDDGNAVLETRYKETHADRERITVYPVDQAVFRELQGMILKYNMYAASKRPRSPVVVMDGDTTTISFQTEKGYFSISDNQVLTGKMAEGWKAIISYMHSLAAGEGVTTLEPQTAMLYLKSGYTLQFIVEDAFDGRLNGILNEEHEVSVFEENGIVLCEGEDLDVSGAVPAEQIPAGTMVYTDGKIIILYTDYAFDAPAYILASLDGYVSSACPLIAEMEGPYRLYLN
ncbi:MAG: hypothetical protein IIY52_00695 [Solobacterium sp.]|nr:hypothetical protein [Solobacterium sp.]